MFKNMKINIPFIDQMRHYNGKNLQGDLSAGLTVGVMLIPQGMAYAMLAGLPPIYGLYASTLPLIIYALLGTSPQLAVGPVAMVALLISSGVGDLATLGSAEFIGLAIFLAVLVGLIQFAMGIFRLGFLVNFLSHPVIAGFTSSAALIIGFSQLKHLVGVDIARGKVHEIAISVIENFSEINLPTLIIGLMSIVLLVAAKRVNKKIPGPLLVVLLGIGLVYFLGLSEQDVKIVRDVPGGLPGIVWPFADMSSLNVLFPIALTIAFVGFMESIAVAKAVENKHKDYTVIPDKELIALGAANIGGSFFQAFPVSGGFSRTAVNDQAGAKTGLASMISAFLVIVTLLFLTDYFYYLPNAVLAAIIMVAVFGLIDFAEARHLWHTDKRDFILFMVTALGTLALGIEEGILIGVVLSLSMIVYNVSYPHIARLGKIPGETTFRNVERFDNLELYDNILILRFDAQLFFANAKALKNRIMTMIAKEPQITHVIIESSAISSLDSSAVTMIRDLEEELANRHVHLCFSDMKGPARDVLAMNNILTEKNEDHFFLSTYEAVQWIQSHAHTTTAEFTQQARVPHG